jgi:hypothetical protein
VAGTRLSGHVDLGEDQLAEALHQGRTQQLWLVVVADEATGRVLARGQLRPQNVALPGDRPSAR